MVAAILSLLAVGCATVLPTEEACGWPVIEHAPNWREVGGPTIFLVHDPPYLAPVRARMAWVRIAARTQGRALTIDLHRLDEEDTSQGEIQPEPVPPEAFEIRPPDLPGEIHFAILDFPSAGCWQLDFKIGGESAGHAVVLVQGKREGRVRVLPPPHGRG